MKQTVLVLGMHRSGTSAIAGVSHLLGAAAPATMMEPAFDNPAGFWESETITRINETILTAAGCTWYDCLTFHPASLDAGFQLKLLTYSTLTLTHEFGDAPLFVLKDPRFSLVLEPWLPTFAAMSVAVAPLIALRHPTEVISSIRRRDGMPGNVAAPLWLHYTLEAEYHTRNRPRAVLSYDRFMQDWRGCLARATAEAGIIWPVALDSAAPAIGEFLRPQLRHHHAAPRKVAAGKPPVSDWIAETYDALRRIEAGDGAAQFARLDRVREQFAAWRASAPRVSLADATAAQLPRTISNTPQTTSTSPATSPDRSVSFR
jgi:hypothetical protein